MKPAKIISFLLMFSLLANLFVRPTAAAADLGKDLAFQAELKAKTSLSASPEPFLFRLQYPRMLYW